MTPINLVLNVLWFIFGGLEMAVFWLVAALLMALTVIGLPWARSALVLARYTLAPFGSSVVRRDMVTGHGDLGTGPLGLVGNLIWLLLAGWWLALGHVVTALALAVSLIGLPFAWAHLKLAALSLWPVGTTVVSNR
jgi:uncharacterized membrane protein YccF (DUF307 family)